MKPDQYKSPELYARTLMDTTFKKVGNLVIAQHEVIEQLDKLIQESKNNTYDKEYYIQARQFMETY